MLPALHVRGAGVSTDRRHGWMLSPAVGYLACILLSLVVAGVAVLRAPQPFPLAGLILLAALVIALARPVLGVYVGVFLAIIGDIVTSSWYPFSKNFSSRESILFVSESLKLSPLDVFLGALVAGWLLRMLGARRFTFRRGLAFRWLAVFTGTVLFGLFYGLSRGGNTTVALWELRPYLYLPLLYVLITNLFDRREQFERLLQVVLVAVSINGVLALAYYRDLAPASRTSLESLVEHSAVLGMNALMLFVLGAVLLRERRRAHAGWYAVLAVPVVWAYLLSQRRAGVVALVVGVLLLFVVLARTDRRRFWRVAPAVLLVGLVYVGAFWSSPSVLGFPAQAVKSVVAPGQLSQTDVSSDLYRQIEDFDLKYTIRSNKLTGIGLGQPFSRPISLPDISFFPFWRYVPHNSVLAIWVKFGALGMLSLLLVFGTALRAGIRATIDPASPSRTPAFVATSIIAMTLVYAYVDMAWSTQTMVLLAVALAMLSNVAAETGAAHDDT